jgi:hypothetical protein
MRGEVAHRQILYENALGIAYREMVLMLRSSVASRFDLDPTNKALNPLASFFQ